jgi:hypothetical protein
LKLFGRGCQPQTLDEAVSGQLVALP